MSWLERFVTFSPLPWWGALLILLVAVVLYQQRRDARRTRQAIRDPWGRTNVSVDWDWPARPSTVVFDGGWRAREFPEAEVIAFPKGAA